MPSKSKVCFFFEKKGFVLQNRAELKAFIEILFKKEKKKLASINYIFCSDKRLLEINQQFLRHDYYTDIITFDLSEAEATQAEIYISIDRVKENAKNEGVSFRSELLRVIFHGALHLCGYKDKTKTESNIMREREGFYLLSYFKD
ncbi:rRNA maturation RNase YbeY [Chitinophagaceae bacterium IBVUCB2]|nr:rRNA maturation RNase YbeY [Chitinophagaceae bacterium IBVUCB2]